MNIVALICARGNSKGIKNKNLLKFKKTSLIGHAIKQARKSKYISKVIVSTDSKKIAKEAMKNKAEVPFLRPANLAKDNSPEIDTWKHAINFYKSKEKIDLFVSVPATAPLRIVSDLDNCIKRAINKKLDIYIVNSYGKTKSFYSLCKNVFLGGSLISHGGQNPLEATRYGCNILHGPNIDNFEDIYDFLKKNKISFEVKNHKEAFNKLNKFFEKKSY